MNSVKLMAVSLLRKLFFSLGFELRRKPFSFSTNDNLVISPKATEQDLFGRFREIIADPLNLVIEKHPLAGFVVDGHVTLHNGIRVPASGANAYAGSFSDVLMINRGVHEPLEEYAFQEVLKAVRQNPTMIELGAYWAHYSMWLQKLRPKSINFMVEPEPVNLAVGMANFKLNNMQGEFIAELVGNNHFGIDKFLASRRIERLDILHSDIQGYEVEMLSGSALALSKHNIDYVFIATHSQELHLKVCDILKSHGYRLEISADWLDQTTSSDGFVFASSPDVKAVFKNFKPLGRTQVMKALPSDLLKALSEL